MKLINRRYQIVDHAHNDSRNLCYLVEDLLQESRRVVMRIMSPETVPSSTVDYLKKELPALRNVVHPGIVHIYDFGVVQTIDGHHVLSKQYYLTHEHLLPSKTVLQAYARSSIRDIANVIVSLCHVLGYLHDAGYIYGRLDHNSVVVTDGADGPVVRLARPMLDADVEKAIFHPDQINMQFISPESLGQSPLTPASDLYSLGVLLFYLLTGHDPSDSNISSLLEQHQVQGQLEPFNQMIDLLLAPLGRRYTDTRQVVTAINEIIGADYPRFDRGAKDRVIANTKLVGRETELRQLNEWKSLFLRENRRVSLTLIDGSMGIGKTRLARELAFHMELERVQVFYSSLSEHRQVPLEPVAQLIRNIAQLADTETIGKYGPELIKLVPDLKSDVGIQPTPALPGERETLRLYDRVVNFVIDTFDRRRAVIMLDNAQWADQQTLRLLDQLLNAPRPIALWIILLYRNEEIEGKPLRAFVDKWKARPDFARMTLTSFGFQETSELIRQMLGMSSILPKLSARVFRETEGNPLLIKDVINTLHAQRRLFLCDDGHWSTDFEIDGEYSRLPLPGSVYEAALDQIAALKDDSREILEILSVFIAPAPLDAIQSASGIQRDRLVEIVDELISLQLADERVGDCGYAYDIHLRSVKRRLYDSMDNTLRRELHRRVAEALKSLPNRADTEISYELVHHLTKAGELEVALESALASAEDLLKLGVDSHALTFLQEAYRIAAELEADDQTIEILFLLGETYDRSGERDKALSTYQEALRLASKRDDIRAKALAKQGIGLLQVRANNLVAGASSLYEALSLAESANFAEGILRASYSICVMMLNQQRYDETIELATKCLQAHPNAEFVHLHALLENLIGACYDNKGQSAEAIERYQRSIELFNLANKHWEAARPINNIGNIYNDHLQDPVKARQYYEQALEIVRRHNQPGTEGSILNNIGETYRMEDEHGRALEYYFEAERLSLEIGRRLLLFVSRLNILLSCVVLGEYNKSCDYMRLSQQEICGTESDLGRYALGFHSVAARLLHVLGDFDQASLHLKESLRGEDEGESPRYRLTRRALEVCIDYAKTGKLNLERIEALTAQYRETGYVKDRRDWLHTAAALLIESGEFGKAEHLLAESDELSDRFDTGRLAAESLLLRGLITGGENGASLIRQSLERCRDVADPLLRFEAHKALGDVLSSIDDLANAAIAYSEALVILYELASKVPKEYQLKFLLSHRRHTVREKLLSIRRAFLESEHARTLSEENRSLNDESSALPAFFGFMDVSGRSEAEIACGLHRPVSSVPDAVMKPVKQLLYGLSANHESCLDMLLSTLAEISGADTACVFQEDDDGPKLLLSQGTVPDESEFRYIIDHVRSEQEGILMTEGFSARGVEAELSLPEGTKALMCIPLVEKGTEDSCSLPGDRRTRNRLIRSVSGYLYLSSSSVFNSFDENAFDLCKGLAGIARLLLENYSLRILSAIDKVSGVYTRKYFEQTIESELHKAAREQYPLSVVMLDIDEFKNVNDRYGHQTGDQVLQGIGNILMENVRPQDICCRYGGEEFVLLLPNTPLEEARVVAERLRNAVESARLMGTSMPLTISLGVASFPVHGEWPDELVTRADQALYSAKELGRNQTFVWNPSISSTAKRTDRLAGIVSGNTVQDQRNVLALIETVELAHQPISKQDKICHLLGKVISVFEAELCMLMIQDKEQEMSEQVYSRRSLEEEWTSDVICSRHLIEDVLSSGVSKCTIDWDYPHDIDPVSGNPVWHSVMAVPMKRCDAVVGVLCISTPIAKHEYCSNELNFAETLAGAAALFI